MDLLPRRTLLDIGTDYLPSSKDGTRDASHWKLEILIARLNIIKSLTKKGKMEQTNEGMGKFGDGVYSEPNTNFSTNQFPDLSRTNSLRPIGDLFGKTWSLTINKYWTILLILAVPALTNVLIVVGYLLALFGMAGLSGLIIDNNSNLVLEKIQTIVSSSVLIGGSLGIILVMVILASIILFFFQLWSNAAIIAEVSSPNNKGFVGSYLEGWKKLFQYWWIGLIVGAAIFGGSMLLVIPGIIFAVWFNYAEFILFSENVTGARAIARSKKYVEGYWWDVFARIILLIISSVVVIGITSVVANLIIGIIASLSGDHAIVLLVLNIIERIISFVITSLVLTFSYNYQYLIYQNLKEIKGQLPETTLSSTQNLVYNGAPALFLVFVILVVAFAGYAIWFTIDKMKAPLAALDSFEEEIQNNIDESDLSSVPTFDNKLSKPKNAVDQKLDTTAGNLQTALETFYTVKGFYPYTEKIDALWTGDDRILDKKMALDECGEINLPTSKCGLYYQWTDKDNYQIIVTHTDGEQSILTTKTDNIDNVDTKSKTPTS